MSAVKDWILKAAKNKKSKNKVTDVVTGDDPGSLFRDINALRESEAESADSDAVEKAKYTDGVLGAIATSKVFEFSTLGMICFNAMAIGFDANYTAAYGKPDNLIEGPVGFIIIENTFCFYFTSELLIRFFAYKIKYRVFCDAWFVFDSLLVTMMILETWVMPFMGSGGPMSSLSIFRLLRLLRITRISRIMRAVPEMMVIIKGMVAAARTVCCTGALMMLVLYTFSIIFTDAYHEKPIPPEDQAELDGEDYFGTMGKSMFWLFIAATVLDDYTAASTVIRGTNNLMLIPFIACTLISSFMMLNMLVGILVEVVEATAEGERQSTVEATVRDAIKTIFHSMDNDCNKEISRGEFLAMRQHSNVMDALADVNIKKSHFQLYSELFFVPDADTGIAPSLNYDNLIAAIFRLRPGGFVSALDFGAFSTVINSIHERVRDRIVVIEKLGQELAVKMGREDVGFVKVQDPGSAMALPPVAGPSDGPVSTVNSERTPPHLTSLAENNRQRLQQAESAVIIAELQRRLGAEHLDKTGMPPVAAEFTMQNGSENLTSQVSPAPPPVAEAFNPLGVPDDDNDSETVYV